MTPRATLFVSSVLAAITAAPRLSAIQQPSGRFLLSCSVFTAGMSEADLRKRFGSDNVTRGSVLDPRGAEGEETAGTVLFAQDADARLEISWNDAAGKRQPAVIRRPAPQGRWRTSSGIRIGTDLKTIEKLNRRPFRLAGLAFDAQGAVVSWGGGQLESQDAGDCHVGVRLRVESPSSDPASAALERQVSGSGIFSSGHPAMQALNPTVYELFIRFDRR